MNTLQFPGVNVFASQTPQGFLVENETDQVVYLLDFVEKKTLTRVLPGDCMILAFKPGEHKISAGFEVPDPLVEELLAVYGMLSGVEMQALTIAGGAPIVFNIKAYEIVWDGEMKVEEFRQPEQVKPKPERPGEGKDIKD